jgi:hypothetical protein
VVLAVGGWLAELRVGHRCLLVRMFLLVRTYSTDSALHYLMIPFRFGWPAKDISVGDLSPRGVNCRNS